MNPNTRMSPDWIRQVVASNPLQKLENGNWRTPPVRLSFPSLFKPEFNKNQKDAQPKHGLVALFPAGVDFTALDQEIAQLAYREFPDYYVQQTGQFAGLTMPFRDQAEKCNKYDGYTPGQRFISCTSKFKPQVVVPGPGGSWVPCVDENKVYPGVWAILTINAYIYGKNPPQPKKGVALGLQNVLIIADDNNLGGSGGGDPAKDFGGVQISQDSNFQQMMGSAPVGGVAPGAPAPAMGYMPAAQPVNTLPIQPLPAASPNLDDLI